MASGGLPGFRPRSSTPGNSDGVAALLNYMKTPTFTEYCSGRTGDPDHLILQILIKERVKFIGPSDDGQKKDKRTLKAIKNRIARMSDNPVYTELCKILPARRTWVTPSKKERCTNRNEHTRKLKNAAKALRFTIERDRASEHQPAYLQKLKEFCEEIRNTILSGNVTLKAPETTAQLKKPNDDYSVVTFRPISIYKDLKTKVYIKLACQYLTNLLDPLFHEEILSYRPRRKYHGEEKTTKADDAIPNIRAFAVAHPEPWVAECDIKNFFDIVNHDQVLAALDRLIERGNIDRAKAGWAIDILKAYLDSYNFKDSVTAVSQEPGFWKPYRKGISKAKKRNLTKSEFRFGWVSEEEFFERGGYSPETWETDVKKIGIPQGGIFSTLICNILMNDVDAAVVDELDGDGLFNRFGDDIILMHANEEGCRRIFEAYKQSLTAHQLVYHDEESVGDSFKDGSFTVKKYWEAKTKAPFRWGRGKGNAAEWIGFVGYEVSCDGFVRLRKSTLNKQFDKICFKYKRIKSIEEIKTTLPQCMKDLDGVAWTILKFEQLDFNPASRVQMHGLDRYRHNKRRKALAYLATLPVAKQDAGQMEMKNPSSFASALEASELRRSKRKESTQP